MQAIYHGKPVVAMPFFGDQPNNADKMVAKVGSPQYCLKTLHLALQVHIAAYCRFRSWTKDRNCTSNAVMLFHAMQSSAFTGLTVFRRAWRRRSASPSLAALRSTTRC